MGEGETRLVHFARIVIYIVVFLAGAVTGIFLQGAISCYRQGLPLRQVFKMGDSFPVAGFILDKGKRCNAPARELLSCFYPLELASAGVFVACYHYFGLGAGFWKYAAVLELLLVISFLDLETGVIPNRFVLCLFIWLFLWQLAWPYLPLESVMTGFLAGGALFYVIALLSRGGMGGGDIKLMAVLGFAVGWPYVLVLFMLSFVLGALVGVALLVSGKRVLKDSLPFAPFLSAGFFLVTFWGAKIWHWYASFW